MNKMEYMEAAEQSLLHTYNRFPLVLDHGEGVYLYDTDGIHFQKDFYEYWAINMLTEVDA